MEVKSSLELMTSIRSGFDDFADAVDQIAYWQEIEYMTERIHSALDYLTPAEFESQLVQANLTLS